jgi:hypothetical protein
MLGNKLDQLLKEHKPLSKRFEMKSRLYGASLTSSGKKRLFPYLFCSFSNKADIRKLGYIIMKGYFLPDYNIVLQFTNKTGSLQMINTFMLFFNYNNIKYEEASTLYNSPNPFDEKTQFYIFTRTSSSLDFKNQQVIDYFFEEENLNT